MRAGRGAAGATLVALVLLGVNLRAAISGVSPLLDQLQRQFGLSAAAMGVLTTLPVLSLGAFAAAAPPLARRFGAERTLVGALVLLVSGILVRLLPYAPTLFAGTALAGAGIAMSNVLMPYLIKRNFPQRVGMMTGLAMMLMSGGAALAAGLAVPLSDAGGWRLALAVWAAPAVLAVLAWVPPARRGASRPEAAAGEGEPEPLVRTPLAWYVTGFLGMQSLAFYVLMSWLPAIMKGHGYSASASGLMLSAMMMLGIPAGLAVPMIAVRIRDQRPLVVVIMMLMALGVGGLLVAPQAGWVWVIVLGVGAGSGFPLAFTLITLRSAGPLVAARLSGMAQTAGYLLAGTGPLAFGILHGVTGGWQVPLIVLLLWLVPETAVALRAARPAQIGTPVVTEVPLRVQAKELSRR